MIGGSQSQFRYIFTDHLHTMVPPKQKYGTFYQSSHRFKFTLFTHDLSLNARNGNGGPCNERHEGRPRQAS
jgi:hypothetical protein